MENNYKTSFLKYQHFFKKSERTHMLGHPAPSRCSFLFSKDPVPSLPSSTNVLSECPLTAICFLIHWQKCGCDFPEFTNCISCTIRKHNSLIHDSNLTLSCRKSVFSHLNRNSGTSVNCHHAIAGYGRDLLGERYNYFSLRIQNKLVASITANCFTH